MTADSNEWWAGIGGEAVGPLSAADVRARWEAGEITAKTLVWRAGFAEWRAAADVPELEAMRHKPAAATAPWQPQAGSTLAALAGAELAALRPAAPAHHGPSGSARLDALTGAPAQPRNEAVPDPRPLAAARADAAEPRGDTARSEPPVARPPSGRRRVAFTSAIGTFALGAAVAVALLVAFRGSRRDREPVTAPAAAAASVPSPSAPAAAIVAPAPAPAPDVAAKGAPAGAAQQSPQRVAQAPVEREPPGEPRPSIAREPVAKAQPVRAANPPQHTTKPERRARTVVKREPRVASSAPEHETPPPKPSTPRPQVAANDPLAMAGTGTAAPRAASRDPLQALVTDSDLDRELGAAPAKQAAPGSRAVAAPAPAAAPDAKAPAANAARVPPAPGSDLPDQVTPMQINEAVKARLSSLRGCIDEQRAVDPAAKGTLKLQWVIAGDGTVKDVKNLSSEYEGKPIARCVSGIVREIRFPTSRTSGQEVVFPFKF